MRLLTFKVNLADDYIRPLYGVLELITNGN